MEWSDEDTERARILYFEKGVSSTAIGRMMGRSRCSVLSRLSRKYGPLPRIQAAVRRNWRSVHPKEPWEARQKAVKQQKPPVATVRPQIQTALPGRPLKLVQLASNHCRWIVGYEAGEALFCADQRTDDPTCRYCAKHKAMAWVKRA